MAAVFAQVELALIGAVTHLARKTAVGAMTAAMAQQKLSQTARAALVEAGPRIQAVLAGGMRGAADGARQTLHVTAGPEAALQVATPDMAALGELLDRAAGTATTALRAALAKATGLPTPTGPVNLFTPYRDLHREAVQRAVTGTRGGLPGSSLLLSRIQAAQKALDDLADQGVTGFVDKAGRRWELVSYVEMATRTAVSTAWDDMQAMAMVRTGIDLVVVATHSTEGSCPHCAPWLGRTLSLTGATPGYPALADAKAAGFRHPNCRCFWAPEGAGVASEVTNTVPLDQAAKVYRASQRQRALDRHVRAAGRRAHAAITPAARSKARRDLAAARAASAAHRERTGPVVTKVGVQRREHPHRAY